MEREALKELLQKEVDIYKNLGYLEYVKIQKEVEAVLEIPFKYEVKNTSGLYGLELAIYLTDADGKRLPFGSVDVYQYNNHNLDSEVKMNYGCSGSFTSKEKHSVDSARLIGIVASKLSDIENILMQHNQKLKETYEYLDKIMDELSDIEMEEEIERQNLKNESVNTFISINANALVAPFKLEQDEDGNEYTTYDFFNVKDVKQKRHTGIIQINFLKKHDSGLGWKTELVRRHGGNVKADLTFNELYNVFNKYKETTK